MPLTKKSGTAGFTIGELARRSGVKLETIRYYERIGMLPGPPRTTHGHRIYSPGDVRTFWFVRRAREAEFTLTDVRKLLRLRAAGGVACAEVRDIASDHLNAIRTKIDDLTRLSEFLEQAITQCSGEAGFCCPVIEMLDCAPS